MSETNTNENTNKANYNDIDSRIPTGKYIIKALLGWLECEFFGIFVFLFFWSFVSVAGVAGNVIFTIIGILIIGCIMMDKGLKLGSEARQKVSLHGAKPCKYLGFGLGAAAMVPSYIVYFILILSRLGVIGNFLPVYKIINAGFFPLIDVFAHAVSINDASIGLFIVMAIAPLLYMFSMGLAFVWGYNNVDLKTKLMYRDKN